MKWFADLPIARKLAVGFTLTTLMTLVLGGFALLRLSEANQQLRGMASNAIPSVQHLGEVRSQLGEFRTYEMAQLTMLDKPEKVADYNKRMDAAAKVVHQELDAYAALPADATERALYAKVKAAVAAYLAANEQLRAAGGSGRTPLNCAARSRAQASCSAALASSLRKANGSTAPWSRETASRTWRDSASTSCQSHRRRCQASRWAAMSLISTMMASTSTCSRRTSNCRITSPSRRCTSAGAAIIGKTKPIKEGPNKEGRE